MITLIDALRNMINRKRKVSKCNDCFVTCISCPKTLDSTGRMSRSEYLMESEIDTRQIISCCDCRRKAKKINMPLHCSVLNIPVKGTDKPRCTVDDINKILLEAI